MDAKDAKEESTPEAQAAESDKTADGDNDDDDEDNSEREQRQLKREADDEQKKDEAGNDESKSDGAAAKEPAEEQVKSLYELSGELVVKLEGTHTGSTATESATSVVAAKKRRVSFEQVVEECPLLSPSTSKVVENVREYVKQIERVLEMDESGLKVTGRPPQPSDALVVEAPKATLEVVNLKSDEAVEHSEESREKEKNEEGRQKSEKERPVESAVEREKSANITDLKKVEMENQEIAERFKLIMEMFDNFTKNLESLEMPAFKDMEEDLLKPSDTEASPPPPSSTTPTPTPTLTVTPTTTMETIGRRRRMNFKSLNDFEYERDMYSGSVPTDSDARPYNEFYRQLHGDGAHVQSTTGTPAEGGAAASAKEDSVASTSAQVQRNGDLRCDIATTCSGLELPLPHRLATIGCQTSQFEYVAMLPRSDSSSFSTSHSDAQNDGGDCRIENFILDAAASRASDGEPKKTTVAALDKAPDSAGLLKLAEPLAVSTSPAAAAAAAVVAGTLTGSGAGAAAATVATVGAADAMCERTFHTIHIEATSSPSSSVMHRPPLCVRMWNVITDFCAAVCLCLQVNKDCLFCLGFFFAFVVSASFLTAFFYRTLSINPQLLRVPPSQSNIEQVLVAEAAYRKNV